MMLPALGLLLIATTALVRRRVHLSTATAAVMVFAAAVVLVSVGSAPARAECNDTPGVPRTVAPATYLVGAAVESINPTPAMIATKQVFLGGYGLSSGTVGGVVPVMDGRYATGILDDGVHSRALAISDGSKALVLAQIETQGVYAAYKNGPYGIEDIRKDAAAAVKKARPSGPALGAGQIMVDSNHTHAGPDTAGV
jgi:hypothetical protein